MIAGFVLAALYFLFQAPLLTLFDGRVNAETFRRSKEYFAWISAGIPFYVFGQAMNPIIRSDGSPRFAMVSTLAGALVNVVLDPVFIFGFRWGMMGAAAGCIPVVGYNMGAGRTDRALRLFGLLLARSKKHERPGGPPSPTNSAAGCTPLGSRPPSRWAASLGPAVHFGAGKVEQLCQRQAQRERKATDPTIKIVSCQPTFYSLITHHKRGLPPQALNPHKVAV